MPRRFSNGSRSRICLLVIPRHLVQNISHIEKRFGRFARGLLFMGRPLFLCGANRKIIHFRYCIYSIPNSCRLIPTALPGWRSLAGTKPVLRRRVLLALVRSNAKIRQGIFKSRKSGGVQVLLVQVALVIPKMCIRSSLLGILRL